MSISKPVLIEAVKIAAVVFYFNPLAFVFSWVLWATVIAPFVRFTWWTVSLTIVVNGAVLRWCYSEASDSVDNSTPPQTTAPQWPSP